jgi:hypothetical protein
MTMKDMKKAEEGPSSEPLMRRKEMELAWATRVISTLNPCCKALNGGATLTLKNVQRNSGNLRGEDKKTAIHAHAPNQKR